ncbi:MAG: phage holin family protein [Oscillospiraceae bacterium]|nr:phage holin family protein [Oscillospiraceae bacterium]
MNEDNILMGVAAAAVAAVGVYFRQLTFPVLLLILAMALDYISGMTRAWMQRELSSKTGVLGVVKKLCYMLGVAVAVMVDFVIQIAAEQTSLDLSGCYFCALLVIVWLILNECISILENIDKIGVPVPDFLMSLVKRLKSNTEQKGGGDDDRR